MPAGSVEPLGLGKRLARWREASRNVCHVARRDTISNELVEFALNPCVTTGTNGDTPRKLAAFL